MHGPYSLQYLPGQPSHQKKGLQPQKAEYTLSRTQSSARSRTRAVPGSRELATPRLGHHAHHASSASTCPPPLPKPLPACLLPPFAGQLTDGRWIGSTPRPRHNPAGRGQVALTAGARPSRRWRRVEINQSASSFQLPSSKKGAIAPTFLRPFGIWAFQRASASISEMLMLILVY